jgi:hypothetical protein
MGTQHIDSGEFYRDTKAWIADIGEARAMKALSLARKMLDLIYGDKYGAETVGDALDLVRRCVSRGSD